MNAYKQPDVGKSRSIFTPGATAAGRCCCRCCFISEDSLPHPGLSLYLSLGPPSLEECALPVSDLASSYLSFLPSVPIFVVSFGPTFIARCGICDSSGTDCSSDVFVPDPTFVLSSLLPSSLLPLHSLFSFSLSSYPPFSHPFFALSLRSFSLLAFCAGFPHRASCNLARGPTILFLRSTIDFRIIDFLHRLHRG